MGDSGELNMTVQIDRELMAVVDEYLERRRRDCDEIRMLQASGSMEPIRFLAHQLKGSGGSFGFDRLSEIGEALGDAARISDEDGIRAALEQLERFLASVVVEYV